MALDDYEGHIEQSLQGVRSILKDNGIVLVDSRIWEETHKAFKVTQRKNTHNGQTYLAEYLWHFSDNLEGLHIADTYFWDNPYKQGTPTYNQIPFAGRTKENLKKLFLNAVLIRKS